MKPHPFFVFNLVILGHNSNWGIGETTLVKTKARYEMNNFMNHCKMASYPINNKYKIFSEILVKICIITLVVNNTE